MKTENKIVAFKGFDSDMSCRGFKYEVGKEYMHEGIVEKCGSGFHACEFPLDVFNFYPPSSRFAKVSLSGEIDRGNDKIAAAKISISAEIKLPELVSSAVDFIFGLVDWSNKKESNTGYQSAATNTGYRSAATNTGDRSAATNTGDQSAATNTGYRSAATNTGDRSAATNAGYQSAATNTGDQSAATNTGNRSAATNTGNQSAATNTGYQSAATNTGDRSAATNTGNQSAATNTGYQSAATNTGYRSAATNTGDRSAATNTGDRSAANVEGEKSVAISSGYQGKAKASKGSAIFLVFRDEEYNIIHAKAAIAGNEIKPDTWYSLDEIGNFVEVE